MNGKNKISAGQFFITLFLCGVAVSMGVFRTGAEKNSLLVNIIIAAAGTALLTLACVPVYLLNLKTGGCVLTEAEKKSSLLSVILKLFYAFCFLVFACVFLSRFALFMQNQINNQAAPAVVTAAFLLIAAFGCCKGFQPLFRGALIVFVFVIFSLVFIFTGLIWQTEPVEITFSPLDLSSQLFGGISSVLLFLLPLSVYAVFADSIKGNSKRGFFIFSLCSMLLLLAAGFFTVFVLGGYSAVNDYPVFIISKLSKISVLKGGDGLLFASLTAVTFLGVYLFFSGASKALNLCSSTPFSVGFGLASYILTLLMCYVPAVMSFFSNIVFLSILSVTATVIIPLIMQGVLKKR